MTDPSAACSAPANTPAGQSLTAVDRAAIAAWAGRKAGFSTIEWHEGVAPDVLGIVPSVNEFTPFGERGAVAWSVWRDDETGVTVEHMQGDDSWRFATMADALASVQAAEGQDELAA